MKFLTSLTEIADHFDAIVLDQWGVLHDGAVAYPGAIKAVERVKAMTKGVKLAVLSNSGRRSQENLDLIEGMGFPGHDFDLILTSGEALWKDIASEKLEYKRFFPTSRVEKDARDWAEGLSLRLVPTLEEAEAWLLMGFPDGATLEAFEPFMQKALERNLPCICSNPDRASPRGDGPLAVSAGSLAREFARKGGRVTYYGKPHRPFFAMAEQELSVLPNRILMVGDSPEHDIAGASKAGWATVFVRGGIHAGDFHDGDPVEALNELMAREKAPLPDYSLASLA